jgi:hypothetical protein
MQVTLSRLRRRLADESGFTMVVVMGVLLIATLFSVAAIAAADGDIGGSRQDVDRKQAYEAAEAGVNDYIARLNQDANYWTRCTDVPAPAPVNQQFIRTSPTQNDPRSWRPVPGSGETSYTIELIPANNRTSCDPAQPEQSMIDANTGSFTIRATGRSQAAGTGTPSYRSITARFRRRGFLDFLYFTDLETLHPEFFLGDPDPSRYGRAVSQCQRYARNGRPMSDPCADLTFIDADVVDGPLHTNDRLLIQGHPDFGHDKKDDIEVVAAPPAGPSWVANGSGNPAPWNGTFVPGAPTMDMPPSNQELANLASWVFVGDTELKFAGNSVTILNRNLPGGTETRNLTDSDFNGVIYVKSDGGINCGTRLNPYPDPAGPDTKDYGCANLWVSGEYSRSVTMGSEGDIIVKASADTAATGPPGLRRNGDVFAGLIANNWVRVEHVCKNGSNVTPGTSFDVRIDAAILSLSKSFTVDNYTCGSRLGTLNVNGAIAQKFRGPVGQFGGVDHGYTKNYVYDRRLLYRSPPYFLDPVQSAWRTVSFTEQSPATK